MPRPLPVLDPLPPPPPGRVGLDEACAASCTELSPRHDELLAGGWQRRFAAAPPRLGEMTDVYRSMRLAVLHEPLDNGLLGDGCAGCAPARAAFRVIYTREEP
jgi:hypothetical protein